MPNEGKSSPPVSASELARALASRPRHKRERVCVVCGKTFQGTARAKYCSRACEGRAFYQRHKETAHTDG
jgi:hypothetical protein